AVHGRHLELVLEVGDRAQPTDQERRAVLACEVDEQSLELRRADARLVAEDLAQQLESLLDREEAVLALGTAVRDGNDDDVAEAECAAHDVLVPACHRIEGAGVDRNALALGHGSRITKVSAVSP